MIDILRTMSRRAHAILVMCLLVVFALQLIHVARVYSTNWDEAHHLYDGYNIWTKHDYRLNAEVPPLVKLMAALPLLPMHVVAPSDPGKSQAQDAFLDGRAFVFGNGGDRLLFPARMTCTMLTLLAAWLIYIAGKRMFGALAGIIALGLFVFDPNVLANGTLVETDLASALFIFATMYGFYRYTSQPNRWRLLAVGLLAGCAMTAKFTGILVAPMLLLLAAAEGIQHRSLRTFGQRLLACLGILLCAWLVIWTLYGFRYAPAGPGLELSPRLGPYLASLPTKSDGVMLAFVARFHLFPKAFIWGLANTKHTEWEYTSYFFGRVYRHGPWEYFPMAFLIKSTLPFLLLLALTPIVWWRARLGNARILYFLLIPVAVYFTVITMSHFDIGARHLMPIYPFLYLLVGATAAATLRFGRVWAAAVCVLLVWQVVTSVRVAPAYMAYGNEAWGGPLQVRRYLSDANVDWGQQLKAVKSYLDRNHITDCWFAYFPDGAVQPQDYGIECHRLPTPSGLWWLNLPMTVPPVIHGTILISESDLDGVESGDGPLNPYKSFQTIKPVSIIQDGVYVYQGTFGVPLASAWVDVRKSKELAKNGQDEAALVTAQQAVQLAQHSAITQLNLAGIWSDRKDWGKAVEHYQAALQALESNRPALQEDDYGPAIRKGLIYAQQQLSETGPAK